MYPKLITDLNKLRHNAEQIHQMCKRQNCKTSLVTKAFCAAGEMTAVLDEIGVDYLADSRMMNLKKMSDRKTKKMLLRIPMLSEVEDVVRYADISLNSELITVQALNQSAKQQGKIHQICLMADLGDLREGYFSKEELMDAVAEIIRLDHIEIIGIGVNLTCYGAVIPKKDNLTQLTDLAKEIRERFGLELPIVSGGNSSSLYLIDKGELPSEITHLRLGESFLLGRETAYGANLNDLHQDVFELQCQIVELKEKPSLPIGEIGVDAFGNVPYYEDKGVRKRAILAIGQQDTTMDSLIPLDDKIEVLGGSSDHLIVDVTDSEKNYQVGDIISFGVGYGALLKAFTSEYVYKEYKK